VAGGAGFLGSHLSASLRSRGLGVVVVDDVSTGRWHNLEALGTSKDSVVCIEQDIRVDVRPAILSAIGSGSVVGVCNLASPASPPEYLRRPIETLEIGSVGTQNLVKLALEHGARFLQASTSEVYGDPDVHPQPETYHGSVNPIGPRAVYDEAKRFGEALCTSYEREHGLDLRLMRIFNTYGPRMQPDDGRVITNFIGQALRGEPLTIYGAGTQTRSFCYVDDLIEGMVALLWSDHRGPMNLGNPNEFTMLELASLVIELTGSRSPLVFEPLPADDPKQRRPDITRAQTLLGWNPKVSLRDGLLRTIEYLAALPPS
jgi:nucleoside-diphosphate-sugar epimerase